MGYYGYSYDWTYILVLIGAVICLLASARVRLTYGHYAKVPSALGITGREAAERVLRYAGITDVQVIHVAGNLTDHYDPVNKTLALSDATYSSTSVAAIGVAAHECGHAVQHHVGYVPLSVRSSLVPAANIGSTLAWPLIIIGLFFTTSTGYYITMAGVLLFSLAVLFQLVTLPVEFNASRRAVHMLREMEVLDERELSKTKRVLKAAAMTYVASAAAAILQLLRLLILFGGKRRD